MRDARVRRDAWAAGPFARAGCGNDRGSGADEGGCAAHFRSGADKYFHLSFIPGLALALVLAALTPLQGVRLHRRSGIALS